MSNNVEITAKRVEGTHSSSFRDRTSVSFHVNWELCSVFRKGLIWMEEGGIGNGGVCFNCFLCPLKFLSNGSENGFFSSSKGVAAGPISSFWLF